MGSATSPKSSNRPFATETCSNQYLDGNETDDRRVGGVVTGVGDTTRTCGFGLRSRTATTLTTTTMTVTNDANALTDARLRLRTRRIRRSSSERGTGSSRWSCRARVTIRSSSSSTRNLLDPITKLSTQSCAGVVQGRRNRPGRNPKDGCDLRFGHLRGIAQHDRRTFTHRETRDRDPQLQAVIRQLTRLGRNADPFQRPTFRGQATMMSPQQVQSNPVRPTTRRGHPAHALPPFQRPGTRLRRDLMSKLPITRSKHERRKQARPFTPVPIVKPSGRLRLQHGHDGTSHQPAKPFTETTKWGGIPIGFAATQPYLLIGDRAPKASTR